MLTNMTLNISIITPSYQQGAFIERTIQSVLSQSRSDISLEYLVFDAASTDNTLNILKKYETQLHWSSEKDNGQTDAINKGIKAAQGDIIGWLNSDDIYYSQTIMTVLDFFEKNPAIDIVYGMANHIDANDHIIAPYPVVPWNIEELKKSCFICQPAVFLRRSLIEKYGLLDENLHYCMDYEYWLRLGLAGAQFAYLPYLLAGSRLHADAKTINQAIPATAESNHMLKKKLGYVPDSWILYYAEIIITPFNSIKRHRVFFLMSLTLTTIYASFRWNRCITKSLCSRFWRKLRKNVAF